MLAYVNLCWVILIFETWMHFCKKYMSNKNALFSLGSYTSYTVIYNTVLAWYFLRNQLPQTDSKKVMGNIFWKLLNRLFEVWLILYIYILDGWLQVVVIFSVFIPRRVFGTKKIWTSWFQYSVWIHGRRSANMHQSTWHVFGRISWHPV